MSQQPPDNTWPNQPAPGVPTPPGPGATPPAAPPGWQPPDQGAGAEGGSKTPLVIGLVVALVVLVGGAFLLTNGGDDNDDQSETELSSSEDEDETGGETEVDTAETTETTEAGVDNSADILAAANEAYTAFAEADCATLDRLLMPGAEPPADCEMLGASLGIELEFTDVELVSQTEDEAAVDHTLNLTDQSGTEALSGTTQLVNQDGEWLIADFNGTGSSEGGSEDSPTEAPPLGDPTAPPTGGWIPFHDELAQNCHDGNMVDCDWLYDNVGPIHLPDSQPHQDYAGTCGGRIGEPANGMCVDWYGSTL